MTNRAYGYSARCVIFLIWRNFAMFLKSIKVVCFVLHLCNHTKHKHRGERAIVSTVSTNLETYSLLAAADLSGIFSYEIHRGTVNSNVFFNYNFNNLRYSLNAFPGPRSVVILDNAAIHKYQPFIELMETLGVKVFYLPPYSPFLNIIELLFNILIQIKKI